MATSLLFQGPLVVFNFSLRPKENWEAVSNGQSALKGLEWGSSEDFSQFKLSPP